MEKSEEERMKARIDYSLEISLNTDIKIRKSDISRRDKSIAIRTTNINRYHGLT